MNLRNILEQRIGMRDILAVCHECVGKESMRAELYALADDPDDRVGYNALWIITHFTDPELEWLIPKRDELIDRVIHTSHTGKRRLILALLERMPTEKESLRTDYLDFCLSRINSTETYGVRALCMKQAFAQCRFYPELTAELIAELELLGYGDLSPGLRTARKNILRNISEGQ